MHLLSLASLSQELNDPTESQFVQLGSRGHSALSVPAVAVMSSSLLPNGGFG